MNNLTVLVAEDNEDDVFLLKRALNKQDIKAQFQTVGDGEEAMAYLRAKGAYCDRGRFPFPALLLLDIKMPRKSGLEVLAEIRHDPDPILARLPVVVFSSSAEPLDINEAYDHHVNSYLVKSGDYRVLDQLM